jgi:Methyltransferase domain
MRGSITSKITRLAIACTSEPQFLPRYLRNLFTPPIDSGLPWFTFGAIDFLEKWIKPHHRIFEYGCGGSTIFFARRAAHVQCVEHSERWMRVVLEALKRHHLGNVHIQLERAGRDPPLANSRYCRALDRPFDLIVIDGWALGKCNEADRRAVQSRVACFERAENFVGPGGAIVLDDAWFEPILENHARERVSFPGVGPWRSGVSQTDLFLY